MTFETILTAETDRRVHRRGLLDRTAPSPTSSTRSARRTPDKIAAIDSRRQVTFAELQAESDRCALGLLELGVRPGDVVSFQLPNWIEFLVLHFAASRIGAVSNPLIPIYREREVGFMVGLAESKVLVVPQEFRGFDYPAMVDRLRGGLAGPGSTCWWSTADPDDADRRGRSSSARRGSSAATRPSSPRCDRTRTTSRC